MAWNFFFIFLILLCSQVLCQFKRGKSSDGCSVEIKCGDKSENASAIVQGFPGPLGPRGAEGLPGPLGPRGFAGPPGHDGYTDRPASFYAELQHLFVTHDHDSILQPWKLSDSFNTPDVFTYFSEEKGIFTVPVTGLYQFFLTISVSSAKASVHITKNGQRTCTNWIESIVTMLNQTIAWGWSSSSIDCFIHAEIGDEIAAVATYRPAENFNSQIYGYSYSVFSGYMLFNN